MSARGTRVVAERDDQGALTQLGWKGRKHVPKKSKFVGI
jgi:hypothetical protein